MERAEQLAANLAAVRERISAACAEARRGVRDVTLVAVTKNFPATDVRLLAGLGLTEVAENRDQEAEPKAAACADLALRWHFVGQLQTNKTRSVAGYADVVESVDRSRLVTALSAAALRAGRRVNCLVQVDLGEGADAGRGGASPGRVPALADEIAAAEGLGLGGVMAVAPLGAAPRPAFERLAEVAADLAVRYPAATVMSAGMSGDLEAAIAYGATHVRIGTALLGGRQAIVR